MRLFGLPYQFISSVDPRYQDISSNVGKNYIEKITLDAPTVIIIPGKAKFLPGEDDKQGVSHMLLEAANGNTKTLLNEASSDPKETLRFYDFQEDYLEYMKYVNIMCRTVASFLELGERINGTALQQFDWKNYRWNKESYTSAVGAQTSYILESAWSTIKNGPSNLLNYFKGEPQNVSLSSSNADAGMTNNFVQFYVDPTSGSNSSMSNSTASSQIKSALDTASSTMKEFRFAADSVGADFSGLEEMTNNGLDELTQSFGSGDGVISSVLNQLLTVGPSVIKGENIILPDYYQNSTYDIDYTIDIHLKSPYGNNYSIYVDVLVPLIHLIALTIPKQATSNTYGSPFLIKFYMPGVQNCNLGIVEGISISRPISEDAYSADGLPLEVDVQLRIKDLYSDLSMSPSDEPALFRNNTSLIDYLATLAGLDLLSPQLETKAKMWMESVTNSIRDIPSNVKSALLDNIERKLQGFISL